MSLEKLTNEVKDILSMGILGIVFAPGSMHIIPTVVSEGRKFSGSWFFPENFSETSIGEKIGLASLYIGAASGIGLNISGYKFLAENVSPVYFAMPLVTNVASGVYEFYKNKK